MLLPQRVRPIVRLALVICLAHVVPAVLGLRLSADVVRLTTGEELRGEVRKEAVREITLAGQGGSARAIPRNQIAPDGIAYDNEPRELRDGRTALEQREFGGAHSNFRAVIAMCDAASGEKAAEAKAKDGKKPKAAPKVVGTTRMIFLQHALWGEARTYADEGNLQNAAAASKTLVDRVPESWYLQDALLLRVRSLQAAGDTGALGVAVKESVEVATKAGVGAEVGDLIRLIQADTLARSGKAAEAQKIYKELERSPVKRVSDQAKLGLARLLFAAGDPINAKIGFKELMTGSKDRSVLCAAALGLGEAQLKEIGEPSAGNAEGLRDALDTFLRAGVLYFPSDSDAADAHQAALLKAGQVAAQLFVVFKKDAKKAEAYRALAQDLYQDVQRTYPRTAAAKAAQTEMAKLGSGGA